MRNKNKFGISVFAENSSRQLALVTKLILKQKMKEDSDKQEDMGEIEDV